MTQNDGRLTGAEIGVMGVGAGYLAGAMGASNPVSAFVGFGTVAAGYYWPTEGFQAGDVRYRLTYEHDTHSFDRYITIRNGEIIDSSVGLRCNNRSMFD